MCGWCACRQGICDAVTESHVSLLLHAGLLMRDMQDADLYLFSMAGAGPVVKSLLKQRKVRCTFSHCSCLSSAVTLRPSRLSQQLLCPEWPLKPGDESSGCSRTSTAPLLLSRSIMQELVTGLRRKRYPEVFSRELENRKPPASALVDQRFLIRDLIGTNTLTQQQTTSGPHLRLTLRH